MEQNTKNDPKNPIFQNFEKQKFAFLSHVPRILSPKIRFLGQKVCSVARGQTDRHESENRRHPFRVSGFFFKFSFNLSSRSGPIFENFFEKCSFEDCTHHPYFIGRKFIACFGNSRLLLEGGTEKYLFKCQIYRVFFL